MRDVNLPKPVLEQAGNSIIHFARFQTAEIRRGDEVLAIPKILLLSDDEMETAALRELLCEHVLLTPVDDIAELAVHLENSQYDAIFCPWSFHHGRWGEALSQIQRRDPDLPVIIFSRTGGEREWIEVLESGAFDLLVAPYRRSDILGVLEQARASYEGRRRNLGRWSHQLKAV